MERTHHDTLESRFRFFDKGESMIWCDKSSRIWANTKDTIHNDQLYFGGIKLEQRNKRSHHVPHINFFFFSFSFFVIKRNKKEVQSPSRLLTITFAIPRSDNTYPLKITSFCKNANIIQLGLNWRTGVSIPFHVTPIPSYYDETAL